MPFAHLIPIISLLYKDVRFLLFGERRKSYFYSRYCNNHKKNFMKNLIAFFEIPAADFERAVSFYETVLGLELAIFEYEHEQMACFIEDGQTVGAIATAPGFQPSTGGVLVHFRCDRIEEAIRRVRKKGGEVVVPKTKIESDYKGHFAVCMDSEGNHFGLYTDR